MAAEVPVSLLWMKLQKMHDEERFIFPGLRNRVVTAVNELEKILNFLKASKPNHEKISISPQETTLLHTIYSAENFTESFLLQRRRKGVIQTEMPLAFSPWTQLWFSFKMMKLVRSVRAVSREFEKTQGQPMVDNTALPDGQEIDALTTHNIDVAKQADPWSSPLEPSPLIEQESDAIVGREVEVQELVSRLINHNDDSLRVISVVGDKAVGKTALARNVFKRLDIRQHFPRRAWLYVSGDLAYRDRLLIILKQIPTSELKDLEIMREDELSDMLFKFLMEYRFLIVLDDVQDQPVDVWHKLFRCFGDAVNGSRVILTTRHSNIAINTDRWSSPLKLRPLNEEKSWSLFLKKVGRPGYSTQLNNLRGAILRICDGLPLAIVLLGGVLSVLDYKEWSTVIRLALGCPPRLANIVDFGYDQHPYVLKPCFLYLALFPKAYEIPMRRLLQLWLAEGFIQSKPDGRIPEDEAKRYLEELVRRNLIEIAKWKSDGSPKMCRMPTYLYDDFLPKANDIGFLHVHHGKTGCTSTDSPESYIPRLADKFGVDSSTSKSHIRHLRSYVSFNSEKRDASNSGIGQFLKTMTKRRGFVLLKVLDLEGVYKPLLPKKLGKLQNLRYLGLRWTGLDTCPESVGDLPCLETLDLKYTNITTLPSSIWKAKRLRHLYMNEMSIKKPPKESSPNLLTLMELHIGANSPEEYGLHNFTSLRKLGLTCHSKSAREAAKCISELVNLQTLRLKSRDPFGQPVKLVLEPMKKHESISNLYLFGEIEKDDICNVPGTLKTLTLSMSELEEDPMPILGKLLPQLNMLRLFAHSYTGKEMTCLAGHFPNLRVFKMWKLEKLEQWKVEQGAMPQLVELEIRVCKNMKSSVELEKLATLKELILTDMPQDFIKDVSRRLGRKILLTNKWEFPSKQVKFILYLYSATSNTTHTVARLLSSYCKLSLVLNNYSEKNSVILPLSFVSAIKFKDLLDMKGLLSRLTFLMQD